MPPCSWDTESSRQTRHLELGEGHGVVEEQERVSDEETSDGGASLETECGHASVDEERHEERHTSCEAERSARASRVSACPLERHEGAQAAD